ncbi:MAG TPA: tripartite tricarboxylate transporter substrate binding protein [Pseudolabrys sp.]
MKVFALLFGLFALTAQAQQAQAAYPERLITIVCASGAGGAVDVTTRVFADFLSKELGQTVLVQNEPGGGSTIAMNYVSRAKPDGYTLLTIGSGVAVAAELYPTANVNETLRELTPVTMVGATPLVLYVNGTVPAKNYADLITWLKAHPNDATTGSNGRGSAGHLSIELLNTMAGVNVRYIPYKTTPQAHTDLIAGRLTVMLTSSLTGGANDVTPVAVSSLERWQRMPNVPTLDELGLKGYEAATWVAMMAPKGTPPEALEKINAAFAKAVKDPGLRKRLDEIGIIPPREIGQAFATTYIHNEITKWTEILRKAPADR